MRHIKVKSEGTPRYIEEPAARVEDIRSAVDYLTTLPYIDEERIGVLGVCAGGGLCGKCCDDRAPH